MFPSWPVQFCILLNTDVKNGDRTAHLGWTPALPPKPKLPPLNWGHDIVTVTSIAWLFCPKGILPPFWKYAWLLHFCADWLTSDLQQSYQISHQNNLLSAYDHIQSELIHAFISSWLDYCNGPLTGLPKKSIERQNTAVQDLTRTKRCKNK